MEGFRHGPILLSWRRRPWAHEEASRDGKRWLRWPCPGLRRCVSRAAPRIDALRPSVMVRLNGPAPRFGRNVTLSDALRRRLHEPMEPTLDGRAAPLGRTDSGSAVLHRVFVALLLFLFALYPAGWVAFPPDVDPINLSLALADFDVAAQRPHAPGYPLFVASARLTATLVGPAHAYQALNLLLLGFGAVSLYAALSSCGQQRLGLAAAALMVSHPLVLAAALAGESYVADAAFGCAVLAVVLGSHGATTRAVLLFAVFLALGTIRPVSVALLLPLAVVGSALRAAPHERVRVAVAAALAGTAAFAAAYGVVVASAGGPSLFRAAADKVMGAAMRDSSVLAGAPWRSHLSMIARLVAWSAFLCAPALAFAGWAAARGRIPRVPTGALPLFAAWCLPAIAFYATVYYLKPTYHLIYLPALLIATAWLAYRLAASRRLADAIMLAAVAVHLAFFAAGPRWPQPLYRLTHDYLERQSEATARLVGFVGGLDRRRTLLVWVDHAELSLYALRLLRDAPSVLVYVPGQRSLQRLVPRTMDWAAAGDAVAPGIDTLVLVHVRKGRTQWRTAEIPPGTRIDGALVERLVR